jgi:hypothetical protein
MELIRFLIDYIQLLREYGFDDEDALFPPNAALQNIVGLKTKERAPISTWKTSGSVTVALDSVCQSANVPKHTPHSVRHFVTEFG